MQTILITGAGPNGVTGPRIKSDLVKDYKILSPSSRELDLTDTIAVTEYFNSHTIDFVIHSALIAPSRGHDSYDESREVESNLRMYFNLTKHSDKFKKMFYFGSGAEFDKSLSIIEFREIDFLSRMPKDKYGFVKYVINNHAINSSNIYNLRLFGTINPNEPYWHNVVSNLCARSVYNMTLNLQQNCRFSFIDIDDVVSFLRYGILNDLHYHDYNLTSCTVNLSELANIICGISDNHDLKIHIEKEGFNREYTADNSRLVNEFDTFTSLKDSIIKVYTHIKNNKHLIDLDRLSGKWKEESRH
ncbi:MAG: NAD-dependent epimerase/dehydratase family protein [Clostridium sp.]|nr:NAD-dependent epimerase/dehydratase family protein [Clostridium sp.]